MRVLGKSAYHCNKSLPLSQLQVMHLDLKTKNVLLTADMVGKVHILCYACRLLAVLLRRLDLLLLLLL